MNDRLICQSCSQQRKELHVVKSSIMSGINLILCGVCTGKGFEPRWLIMLALAQNGITPEVKKMVEENRYEGNSVTLSEYLSIDK